MSDPAMYDCEGAVAEARSMLEDLGQEMRDWFENTPEGLQQSDKMQSVDGTAGILEDTASNLEDAPECATAVPQFAVDPMTKKRPSRAHRCGYACSILASVIEAVNNFITDKTDPTVKDELESWVDNLQCCHDDAEAAEFPGMYG